MLARHSLALVLVCAPFVAGAGQPKVDVTGSYHSNWDDVQLVQDGNRVHGTYVCCGGGTIEGTIRGRILRYHWESPAGGVGNGVWLIESTRLEGTWGSNKSDRDGGRWDLWRVDAIAN
jgi:hypothetical protein